MELTHDNSLYVIEYDFEGQTIRHTFQNRSVYLDVEDLHFDLGLGSLESFLESQTEGELGNVYIEEDIDEDEEEYEEKDSMTIKTDEIDNPSQLYDPAFIEQLEQEGKLIRETYLVRKECYRFSHNRFMVYVYDYDKVTHEEYKYKIGYLPVSATPLLRLWIDYEFEAWVEAYSLNPDNPYLKLSVTAFLYYLNDKSAQHFKFYRIKAEHAIIGGDIMRKAVSIDWKEFCEGVMDQQMELGAEYKLMDDYDCCMNRWTYPNDVHFDKVFKTEKKFLNIDDFLLHVPLESISELITPNDVYDSMAGCVIGFMTNRPFYKSGKFWALVPPYELNHPMSLTHKMDTNDGYFHLADVPAQYNNKVTQFIEGEHTPAFVHLTTEFCNGLPKVVGDMYLLKCFEGHEDEIQSFAKWLFSEMNHKNDFPEKIFYLWDKKQHKNQVS